MNKPFKTRAVVSDPSLAQRFEIRPVELTSPRDCEAIVAVHAFSLNAGEVRDAMESTTLSRPGWDLAGVVERAAADGSGPSVGTRVVGLSLRSGSWAQHVVVPSHALAPVPESVDLGVASALPVAGLTALHALTKGGLLLGKRVLVTGASGGVGRLACRLAVLSGAHVTAMLRSEGSAAALRDEGVHEVLVGDHTDLEQRGTRFSLVLESIGGPSLARSLMRLEKGGACVVCGNGAKDATSFGAHAFYHQGGVAMLGLFLVTELEHSPASRGLGLLVDLVQDKRLAPPIEVDAPWEEIATVAARYHRREISGKVVLRVDP